MHQVDVAFSTARPGSPGLAGRSVCRRAARRAVLAAAAIASVASAGETRAQLGGEIGAHDPSTLIKDGSTYHYFATGPGIVSRRSTDKGTWVGGPSVFGPAPAWTQQAVPSFGGLFWAPDVAYFNGKYHLYYSASSWGTIDSAIGVATSPSLANPTWTDQGKVVQSDAAWEAGPNTDTTAYNAIDPSILVDNGDVWMAFGSYSSGILVTRVNPSTGKRANTTSLDATLVANNAPGGGWGSSVEGAALIKRGGHYYLFVNYGGCCAGVDSTYEIRVGRGTSPTGPFLDRNGTDMRNGGGTLFLDDDGKSIGPGHFSYFAEAGQDSFGYHYYDGDRNGAPTYGLRDLYWTADAWPSYAAVNPNWSGSLNGGWSAAANWSGLAVPNGVGHVANFGANVAGRYVVSLDGAGRTVSTVNFSGAGSYTIGTTGHVLTLDARAGDSATLNVSAGNHVIAAPVTATDKLGVNVTPAAGTLTLGAAVSAPAMTKYGQGTLALGGANAYGGSVLLKRGTLDVNGSVTAGQYSSIGPNPNDAATMVLRGTGRFTANGDFNVGDTGDALTPATGTLELRDNASLTVNAAGGFFVGSGFFAGTRAVGAVNQGGGTLTANGAFDGAFVIGGRNSSLAVGTYNLAGGTVNANTNVRVGGRGTGSVNQTGGTFNASGFVAIGRFAGATGAWDVRGGALNVSDPARLLIVGEEGRGTLTVGGAGQVSAAGPLRIGHAGGGAGTVNLDGGTISAPLVSRGAGTAILNFNGGTLRAAGAATTFLQGLTAAHVKAGGAVVDTQAFDIRIAQPLLADPAPGPTSPGGGLRKVGAGTLTLGGKNAYTGGTAVNAGTLVAAHEDAIGVGRALSIENGATTRAQAGLPGALDVGPLSMAAAGATGGTLDLADNALVVRHADAAAARAGHAGVNGLVRNAFNEFAWNQPGVTSSTVAVDVAAGIPAAVGVLLNNDGGGNALFYGDGTALPRFEGRSVDGNSVLVKDTLLGDGDLNGTVDSVDFALFQAGYTGAAQYTGFAFGDYDYNGMVDSVDFGLFQAGYQYGQSSPTAEMVAFASEHHLSLIAAAVPEPTSLGLMALAGGAAARSLTRRRTRRTNGARPT